MATITHDIPTRSAPRLGSGLFFALVSATSFGVSGSLARGLLDAGWTAGAAVTARILIAAVVLLVMGVLTGLMGALLLLSGSIYEQLPDSTFNGLDPSQVDQIRNVSRAFVTGFVLLGLILVLVVLTPWIAPGDPNKMAVRFRFRPPSAEYPFGTDNLGRNGHRQPHAHVVKLCVAATLHVAD